MSTPLSFAAKAVFRNRIPLVLLLALPSCLLGVDGNGERTEETRDLHDFSSVDADGSLDVRVQQGDITSVVVSIDSNLQERTRTRVADGRLMIDVSEPIGDTLPGPHTHRDHADTGAARLVGSGNVSAETYNQVSGDRPQSEGSGNMTFGGEVPTLTARLDGSGNMRLRGSATSVVPAGGFGRSAPRIRRRDGRHPPGRLGSLAATVTGRSRVTLDGSGNIDLYGGGAVEPLSASGSGGYDDTDRAESAMRPGAAAGAPPAAPGFPPRRYWCAGTVVWTRSGVATPVAVIRVSRVMRLYGGTPASGLRSARILAATISRSSALVSGARRGTRRQRQAGSARRSSCRRRRA